MPNMRRRVNSLTQECEKNTQMNQETANFSEFYRLLSDIAVGKQSLTCGQLGLGSVEQLLAVHAWLSSAPTSVRIKLKVFEAQLDTLPLLISQLRSYTPPSSEQGSFIQTLTEANPIEILGCQRLIFDDGRFVIDLYLNSPIASLKSMRLPTCDGSDDDKSPLFDLWTISQTNSNRVESGMEQEISQALLWQMAKVSQDSAPVYNFNLKQGKEIRQLCQKTGFSLISYSSQNEEMTPKLTSNLSSLDTQICLQERKALRHAQAQDSLYTPVGQASSETGSEADTFAIIGGGVASAHLALSLAQRNKTVRLFCNDSSLAQQASGNKQGAVYPLLTPDNGHLSHYYQQGYLFSRRRLQSLIKDGFKVGYDFCGVLQTGFDQRSSARLEKIITAQPWNKKIAHGVDRHESSNLAGIDIDKAGIFYPLGGWICPHEFTQAAFDKASQLSDVSAHFNTDIKRIEQREGKWYLHKTTANTGGEQTFGPFNTLILANGQGLNQFNQSKQLAATGFRGQVSHIPARNELLKLNTVLCSHGYLTPQNDGVHCTGASYIKNPEHLDYSPSEQVENLEKVKQSYLGKAWTEDVDISDHSARVGVRMVTRDHAPMMGCAPDFDVISLNYQDHQHTKESIKYWRETPAPIHQGLFILGGLGSRGITSGPLAAEALAAQLCGEIIPLDSATLELLNPNRMWMRKLIKGKAL